MSNRPEAEPPTRHGRTLDRITGLILAAGFWLPLLACTWLALTPSPPESVFRVSDLVLHAAAFAYLTFALGLAHGTLRFRAVVMWMVFYGLLIELIQSFEPERSAELKDLVVDGAGIAVGLMLLMSLGPWSRRVARRIMAFVLGSARRLQRANS